MINKKIACIWARETPDHILDTMFNMGIKLASRGYTIASWNAKWADEFFAKGANLIKESSVNLYLPTKSFNNYLVQKNNKVFVYGEKSEFDKELSTVHKNWSKTKEVVKQLHRRNYWIIEWSLCVVCYTLDWTDRGGTGIGIRLAQKFWIPVFNLFNETAEKDFYDYLSMLENNTNLVTTN